MPALYRSRSYRRPDDKDSPLTDFLEKDNFKVLTTAAAQLFISAPHLDKWFKSSTGTICFLKNFSHKNSFYFRLYSLMVSLVAQTFMSELNASTFFLFYQQGKLWEQEMNAPFAYQKASPLFHFLTVNVRASAK